ncbi:unnamed protein product [Trifolium pratense]|uniref:Uncharacterized protein n=1 Tax=Trifolium pratense TaxID=57577 RepID=A0ACB0IYL3_TRIPR|nr:unnamed protein product [Trifolium pratense]
MGETLKFVYIMILFISLFIVVVVGKTKCETDEDCYISFPNAPRGTMACFRNECKILRTGLGSSIEVFVCENKVENYSLTYDGVFIKVCWIIFMFKLSCKGLIFLHQVRV